MGTLRLLTHAAALTLLVTLADVSLLLALCVKPFSEPLAWEWACWTAEGFWQYMQNHWENTLGARPALVVTGDALPEEESAIVLPNHLSYADYYLVQSLAVRAGMLGRCRYFVKREIVWRIPFFGWAFWGLGMILISRNWTNDAGLIRQAFSRIKQNGHAVWIVLYPEGTRRTPTKLWKSRAFARQNNKPELQRVLLPRTKGFVATVQGLRDSHIKHLYDLTFQYTSPALPGDGGGGGGDVSFRVPSLGEQLACGDLKAAGYGFRVHVKRWAIAELPGDEQGLKEWCENVWRDKDALLGQWAKEASS